MSVHRIQLPPPELPESDPSLDGLFDPATGQLLLESPEPEPPVPRTVTGRLRRTAVRLGLVLALAGGAGWLGTDSVPQLETPPARVILRDDVDPTLQRAALGIPLSPAELAGRSCHALWMTLAWSFGRHHPVVRGPALRLFRRQSPGWTAVPGRSLTEVHQEHFTRFDRANERAVRAVADAQGCRPL